MKRRLLVAASVLGLSGVLAACAPSIQSGIVIGKSFTPAHTDTYEQTVSVKPLIMVPETRFIPDDWQLQLQHGKKTGWVDVSQGTYNSEQDGDSYTVPGSKD